VWLLELSGSLRLLRGSAAVLADFFKLNQPVSLVEYAQGATGFEAFGRLLSGLPATAAAADLPLTVLPAAQPHLATLHALGCTRWRDLQALPRAGVVRRWGAPLLHALDQALGLAPEAWVWLQPAAVFATALELPHPTESAPALLLHARRLLARLQLWLRQRQQAVWVLALGWGDASVPAGSLDASRAEQLQAQGLALLLRLAEPATDMASVQRLLAERLARMRLAQPAQCLWLHALHCVAAQPHTPDLWAGPVATGETWAELLQRLSQRLGPAQVRLCTLQADHRPEHMQRLEVAQDALFNRAASAYSTLAIGQKDADLSRFDAALSPAAPALAWLPTWLLSAPVPLHAPGGQPQHHGRLQRLAGPHRLEAGWWGPPAEVASAHDPGPALRDYFVARNPQGEVLWVFCTRSGAQHRWWLHGFFA
jgi:protein ImuB